MRTKIKARLKEFISILVCVMMVLVTCPVNMLSGAAFAQDEVQTPVIPSEVELLDDGQEISLEGGGASSVVVSSLSELQNAINNANPAGKGNEPTVIALTKDITTRNALIFSSPEYSLECNKRSIIITSANPSSPQTITIKSTKSGLLRAKNSNVTLKNINIVGTAEQGQSGEGMQDIYKHSAIRVEGGSIAVGEGVKFSKYSKIDSENISDRANGGFIWCDNGTVNIEGGEFSYCGSKNSTGGVVYCSGGIVDIKGGSFHNCSADRGIIFSDNATVNITRGNFNKCYARLGSVVYANGGSVNISGGNFEECSGSAVILSEAKLVMTGGNFVNCICAGGGGAVEVCLKSSFIMTGGTISGCYASRGGAIYVARNVYGSADPNKEGSASFIMQGGEIFGCHADQGGAIYVDEDCGARLEKGTITGCYVPPDDYSHGSAIFVCYTSTLAIAQKESDLFKILNVKSGYRTDTYPSSCGGYDGIYLCERPKDSRSGYQYTEVIELDDSPSENDSLSSGGFVSSNGLKSNLLGIGGGSDSNSETSASENYVENAQYEENEPSIGDEDADQSSDNDVLNDSSLQAFLDADKGSEIVQKDYASGIVLTAKDKIIPKGYHLFVETIQKDSDDWKNRIKDIDSKHLNNIEKMGLYDISIRKSIKDKFELPGDSTVTVFIPRPDGYDDNDLQILHISSGLDGEFDEEIKTVSGKTYCKFKTNHFSPYSIIDEISKNDLFEMMAPWLIGAAVVAIGAVVVVVILKNKAGA